MTQNSRPSEPTSLLGRWELTGFFEEDAGRRRGPLHDARRRGGPWTSEEKEQRVLEPAIEDHSDSDLDMDNVVFTDGPARVLMVTPLSTSSM